MSIKCLITLSGSRLSRVIYGMSHDKELADEEKIMVYPAIRENQLVLTKLLG